MSSHKKAIGQRWQIKRNQGHGVIDKLTSMDVDVAAQKLVAAYGPSKALWIARKGLERLLPEKVLPLVQAIRNLEV